MLRLVATLAFVNCLALPAAWAATVTADGVVLISHADALAGNVTPGDTAGYPITINRSGTYRLKSNLAPTAGKSGFFVQANEVTLDLNGFAMTGSATAVDGVSGAEIVAFKNLTVMNGTIRNFGQDGVLFAGPGLRVENMRVIANRRYGINELYLNASPKTGKEDGHAIIRNNVIMSNFQGITCQSGCHIEGNVISHNQASAIIISQSGATVINNTISNNGGYGVVGNYVGLGGNTIFGNGYCHTSGVMMVMGRNAIYPQTGTFCVALPGN